MIVLLIVLLLSISCNNDKEGNSSHTSQHIYPDISVYDDVDTEGEETQDTEDIEEDIYSIWTDPCVKCDWYFCGNLDVVWQKQICINTCDDPQTVVHEGECEEHLECNPAQYLLEADIPCINADGYPGVKEKICIIHACTLNR